MDLHRLNNLNNTGIDQFFEALLNKCKEDGVYSVIETAEKMNVPYDKVKEWASKNERWEYTLAVSRCYCACHSHDDWSFFKLPDDLGLKYCLENDDEFSENYKEFSDF